MAQERAMPAPRAELFTSSGTALGLLHWQAQTWVRAESTDTFLMPMGSASVLHKEHDPSSLESFLGGSGHLQRKPASLSMCYTTRTQAADAGSNVHPALSQTAHL